ncbi:hypothetical protein ACWCOT_45920 [Nonomuraea bangladeshensis]
MLAVAGDAQAGIAGVGFAQAGEPPHRGLSGGFVGEADLRAGLQLLPSGRVVGFLAGLPLGAVPGGGGAAVFAGVERLPRSLDLDVGQGVQAGVGGACDGPSLLLDAQSGASLPVGLVVGLLGPPAALGGAVEPAVPGVVALRLVEAGFGVFQSLLGNEHRAGDLQRGVHDRVAGRDELVIGRVHGLAAGPCGHCAVLLSHGG